MKKFLSAFLALAMVFAILPAGLFTLPANAATGGYYYTYTISGGEATITDVKTSISGAVTIPSTLGGYPVTSIGDRAFEDCTSLKSVTIPDSVMIIEFRAFENCTSLTDIIIPDGVTSIEDNAFYNTAYYNNSLNWENDVIYISNHLIEAKTSLSGNYIVKEGTKTIGDYAFQDCTSLISVTIPDSVMIIGDFVFQSCTSLTSITIPDSVVSIGFYAFENCTSFKSITIPDSVTNIGYKAFSCKSLESITVEEGNPAYHSKDNCLIETATNTLLLGCKNSIIPNYVISIGEWAFYASSLTSITIPDSVTSIGYHAFCNCDNLINITIPDSITSIGQCAFKNTAYYNNSSNWENGVLYIGNHLIEADSSLSGAYTIKARTKTIADYAFSWRINITSVTIPDSVTSIGRNAFYICDSLVSIIIPNSVTSIEDYTFYNCDNLTSVTIGNSVTSIGNSAFFYCTTLTSISLPDSLTKIGDHAFAGCSLKTVYHPCTTSEKNITIGLGNYDLTGATWEPIHNYTNVVAVPNCTEKGYTTHTCQGCGDSYTDTETDALGHDYGSDGICKRCNEPDESVWKYTISNGEATITDVDTSISGDITIPSTLGGYPVTSIGDYAFSSCTSLTSITIPDSVTSIGYNAFEYCTSLKSLNIPDGVTSIKDYAFCWCTSLTSITIPDSVTSIGNCAFPFCDSLTSVTIGNGVTSIGYGAFEYCTSLTSITIPDSVTSIGEDAFSNCLRLKTVYYPCNKDINSISIDSNDSYLTYAQWIAEHSYDDVVKEPTCTEKGYTTHYCTVCGDSYTDSNTTALGHNYSTTVTEPTCTENGYTTYTCTTCGDTYKGNYTNVKHNYAEVVTKPTCTEKGYTTYTCEICGDTYKGNYISGSHSFEETVIPPTVTDKGYTVFTCTVCGHSYNGNFVDPIPAVSGLIVTPTDVDVTLSWNAYDSAVEYYAKVYDKDFTKCLKTITTKGTSAIFDNKLLSYNTDYKFIVTAKLSNGKYLTVANATRVDGKMVIGERVVGLTATIKGKGAIVDFLPVEKATEYLVNVFENNAQGTRIYTATLSKDETSARVMNNLVAGTKYVVMINAKVDGKYMPLSDLRVNGIGVSFTAPVVNPDSVTIAEETATSIRFNWNAVRGATEYYIRVKEKSTGILVNTLKAVGKTTATLSRYTDGTRISANTAYTLEICAYVPGLEATYGQAIDVTTIDYETIKITARYNQNINKINLSWNKTTNAVGYFVYTYKDGIKIATKYIDGADNTVYEFTSHKVSGTYTYGVVAYEKNSSGTAYTPVSISNIIYI